MMTGISSVRSWVIVTCSLIPRAYLNSYFLAKIRTNCEQPLLLVENGGIYYTSKREGKRSFNIYK